jgi:hypothetical protein
MPFSTIFYIAGGLATCLGCAMLVAKIINRGFDLTSTWKQVVASVKAIAATLEEIKQMLHAGELRMERMEGELAAVKAVQSTHASDIEDLRKRIP